MPHALTAAVVLIKWLPPKTQPARGMRDFLPADVRRREYVIGVIKKCTSATVLSRWRLLRLRI